ncbi:MAG: hypothetical protein HKO13_10700 [Sphingomonas sp.]|nr:hypothetical protein [Sphingomonas sp.]
MILAALLLQAVEPVIPMPPTDPVAIERTFASDAQRLGQWTAFAKWAHDDAIIVGRSVINAKTFAEAQDNPPQAIRWWPVESFRSCDGRTAFNVGGWEDPVSGEKGRFHTVWVHGEDGWRYIVDIGSRGQEAMADTGGVEIRRASCLNEPEARKPAEMLARRESSDPPRSGSSIDGTLMYRWHLGDDGSKSVTLNLWDGYHPRQIYRFDMPPPAPEPAQ